MCLPKTLFITHRGFVSYCDDCKCVNMCFDSLLIQYSFSEFREFYGIVYDFLQYHEPMCANPDFKTLEFSRFANKVSWMVSISDLKDLLILLRKAHQAIDSYPMKQYTGLHEKHFTQNLPELFRLDRHVN